MNATQTTDKPDRRVEEARRVKARIVEAGLSLADIDRRFGLRSGQARETLRYPDLAGERAIAAALGTRPHLLWKTRYRPSGQRRSPLDWNKIRLTVASPKIDEALS